jgi:hypothetical protein
MEVSGQLHALAHLPPRKERPAPNGQEAGWAPGKGKVVPVLFLTEHHAMKAYLGSGGIAPLTL